MDFFVIPRRMARLQYLTARLPFTIFDKYVADRYLGDQALPRQGLKLFLGSMDELAGFLLADDHISRPGQAREQAHEAINTAAEAEQAPQAAQTRISAAQDQAGAAASRQRPDAADNRRLVRYRPEEADNPGQFATSEHDTT